MLLAAAATALLSLDRLGMHVVGAVPAGLPAPGLPAVSTADLVALLLPAFGVALVAYNDNVLTARAFAVKRNQEIDADQEMLALGVANAASGLLHGFPVSSSGSRTVIGDALGGRSQLSSLVTLLAVIAVLAVGGPVLSSFPMAALGALVVYAALRLVDVAEFRRLARFRRSELAIALATTLAVLAVGVLYGVLVAVGLSILDLLRKVSRPHDGILGFVPGLAGMHDVDDYPEATTEPGLVIYRYDAPLCFANAEDFRRRALAALDAADPPARWLLLNTEAIVELDVTAADALHTLCDELDRRGVEPALARVKQDLLVYLDGSGLRERIGDDRIFPTLPTAVAAFRATTPTVRTRDPRPAGTGPAVLPPTGQGRARWWHRCQEDSQMDSPQAQHNPNELLGVVVGVEGSRIGLDAVRWAVDEARLRGLPLRILHAAPYAAGSTSGTRHARDILARAYTVAHRADPGLTVSTRHTERDAIASLLDAAQHAQLLVVGMGGGERPHEVLIDSVALDVSGRSPCPVAVVRGAHPRPADASVLVGVDDPAIDAAALTVAFGDAHRHRGRVVVLHAGHGAPFGHDALAPWTARFPKVPVELTVVRGSPVPALLAAAVDARLVVLGTRARRTATRTLFGSTSRGVLRRSPVPVVVVNPGTVRLDGDPVRAPAAPEPKTTAEDPHDRSELR